MLVFTLLIAAVTASPLLKPRQGCPIEPAILKVDDASSNITYRITGNQPDWQHYKDQGEPWYNGTFSQTTAEIGGWNYNFTEYQASEIAIYGSVGPNQGNFSVYLTNKGQNDTDLCAASGTPCSQYSDTAGNSTAIFRISGDILGDTRNRLLIVNNQLEGHNYNFVLDYLEVTLALPGMGPSSTSVVTATTVVTNTETFAGPQTLMTTVTAGAARPTTGNVEQGGTLATVTVAIDGAAQAVTSTSIV